MVRGLRRLVVCAALLGAACGGSPGGGSGGGNTGGTAAAGRGGTTGASASGGGGEAGVGGATGVAGTGGGAGAGTGGGGGATAGAAGSSGAGGVAGGSGGAVAGTGGAAGRGGATGAAGTGGTTVSCAQIAPRDPNAFVHPGGLHKRSDMDRMRYLVAAGVEPWAAAYQKLRADSLASPTYAVRGNPTWTQVSRDGGVHASEFESDANAAYLQALMWIVTQDTRHAQKCVEIFNAWRNLTEVTGGGTAPLNAGLYAYKLVEAAEIIKSTYTGWAAAESRRSRRCSSTRACRAPRCRRRSATPTARSIGASTTAIPAATATRI